jgi:hypothetical protein
MTVNLLPYIHTIEKRREDRKTMRQFIKAILKSFIDLNKTYCSNLMDKALQILLNDHLQLMKNHAIMKDLLCTFYFFDLFILLDESVGQSAEIDTANASVSLVKIEIHLRSFPNQYYCADEFVIFYMMKLFDLTI